MNDYQKTMTLYASHVEEFIKLSQIEYSARFVTPLAVHVVSIIT